MRRLKKIPIVTIVARTRDELRTKVRSHYQDAP